MRTLLTAVCFTVLLTFDAVLPNSEHTVIDKMHYIDDSGRDRYVLELDEGLKVGYPMSNKDTWEQVEVGEQVKVNMVIVNSTTEADKRASN